MRNPKDFFRPLAVGAPEPLREIPVAPSRMIHFFPPSNEKMVAKVPDIAPTVDVLLANLEDGVPAADKEAARAGLVQVGRTVDFGRTQFWTRVNSLDSPWGLDDLVTAVTEVGDRLDVIMIPKVEGPEPGVFQPEYKGNGGGFYGVQGGFVAKLSADGSSLLWSSNVGIGQLTRDFTIDAAGDIYLKTGTTPTSPLNNPPAWFAAGYANAYQSQPVDSDDAGLIKITGDGTTVVWATWLGGHGVDSQPGTLKVDVDGNVYMAFYTQAATSPPRRAPTTRLTTAATTSSSPNSARRPRPPARHLRRRQRQRRLRDAWARPRRRREHVHHVRHGFARFRLPPRRGPSRPRTPGPMTPPRSSSTRPASSSRPPTSAVRWAMPPTACPSAPTARFSTSARPSSTDFPVSANAHQSAHGGGGHDFFVVRLSSDLTTLVYATYLGGVAHDNARGSLFGGDCALYVVGASGGPGFPVVDAWQPAYGGGVDQWGNGDNVIAKFTPK